ADFKNKIPTLDFNLTIEDANMMALKFDTVPSSLSAELRVRMNGFDMEQLNGSASVYDLRYRRGNNNLYVDSIVAITNGTSIYRKTTINSNLFDFTAVG